MITDDRNLLFGILAVQMNFVARNAVIAAMHAWVLEKSKPLGRILVEQQALSLARHEFLEQLVAEHLAAHGGDGKESLAATDELGTIRAELELVADSELQATGDRMPCATDAAQNDSEGTLTYSEGSPPTGSWISILRRHAKRGWGQISMAFDSKANHEVALKELRPRRGVEPTGRARFLHKAEVTGRLEHPGVVPESQDVRPLTASSWAAAPLPSRFVFADALRGIAAMWVVLFHAHAGHHLRLLESWLPAPALAFFEAGHLGVSIFFVLSGFVISYSVSRYRVDFGFVGRFALRRAIRLDPPYCMSIVLFITITYISRYFVPNKMVRFPDGRVLAAHFLYLQGILEFPEINPVYWTLCLEVQFYLVFCFLMVLAHRFRRDESDRRSIHAVFVPAALLAAAWPLRVIPTNPWPGLFFPSWHGFLIGVGVCWAMQQVIPLWWFYAYAVLLGLGGIWYFDSTVLACVLTATLLMEAARRGKLAAWLRLPAFLFVGMISYSLYLIHNPITGAFYRVAYKISGRSPAAEAFWFLPMIGVNIACAFGFWWLFERTSLVLGHRVSLGKSRLLKRTKTARPRLVASEARQRGSPIRDSV